MTTIKRIGTTISITVHARCYFYDKPFHTVINISYTIMLVVDPSVEQSEIDVYFV